jgi:osmoprotectant transport system permease protein
MFDIFFKSLKLIIYLILLLLVIYLWDFFRLYSDQLILLTLQHLRMIALAMPPAILLGVGLGIFIYRFKLLSGVVISGSGVMMTIPSIALFGVMIPLLAPLGIGVGTIPTVTALILYSQLPIIRNTYVALVNVPQATIKAARGMGLSNWQILWRIEIPLAIPVILTGIRQAIVLGVGIAAIAAYIGGGGLGRWIFGGIRRTFPEMILGGALIVSVLAITLDWLLLRLQKFLTSWKR